LRGAILQMVSHQGAAHRAQRLLHGGNLHQDIGAVSIFADQALQAAYLTFNAAQPLQIGKLNFRIHRQGFAGGGCSAAAARQSQAGVCCLFSGHRYFQSSAPEASIHTPSPYVKTPRLWPCCYNPSMTLMEITYE